MANLNLVFLMGNLTRNPELRYTPSGAAVSNLRLAVNRRYKTQTGEFKEDVTFITVVTWGKQAETCAQFLSKGKPVFVEGRLQMRSWETPDGQKRNVLEVRAWRIQFLGSRVSAAEEGAEELKEEGEEELKEDSLAALLKGEGTGAEFPASSGDKKTGASEEAPF